MKILLVIAKILPEPVSSAAGSRLLQLMQLFRHNGWEVHLATQAQKTEYSIDAVALGFPFHAIQVNDPEFEKLLHTLSPQVVLFDRFMTEEQFGWKVAEHCPDALRILDTEDLHGLRFAREKALKENRAFVLSYLHNPVLYREIASIWRSDLSLIISGFEMDLLHGSLELPERILHYLPFLAEDTSTLSENSFPAFEERRHFLSIGNFLHAPNLDAVHFLHRHIWPLIHQRLPETQLHVYGAYMPESIKQLHAPENGFLTLGRAQDVNRVMQEARLNLAPLRFGAGLKGKVFDAMKNSTPTICSSIAAEGMGNENSSGFLVADDANEFAELAVSVYRDKGKWKQVSENCKNTLRLFMRQDFESSFFVVINGLLGDLENHREKNFTGALLQHHAFYSNKYMGLWIEAKNKAEKKS